MARASTLPSNCRHWLLARATWPMRTTFPADRRSMMGMCEATNPVDDELISVAKSYLSMNEFERQAIGARHQVLVCRQVVRGQGHPTRDFRHEFRPIPVRQGLELVEEFLCGLRHGIRVPCCVLRVKPVADSIPPRRPRT